MPVREVIVPASTSEAPSDPQAGAGLTHHVRTGREGSCREWRRQQIGEELQALRLGVHAVGVPVGRDVHAGVNAPPSPTERLPERDRDGEVAPVTPAATPSAKPGSGFRARFRVLEGLREARPLGVVGSDECSEYRLRCPVELSKIDSKFAPHHGRR